jgi:multiple sugar transport system substrate-binding protein
MGVPKPTGSRDGEMMRLRSIVKFRWFPMAALTLALAGCGTPPPPKPVKPFAGLKLVVGVVGNPAILPSIKAQRGEWAARTDADLVVLDEPVRLDGLAKSNVDVLVFPGDRMGDLVDIKALAVLPDSVVLPPEPTAEGSEPKPEPPPDAFQYKDIVLGYRDQVTRYGADRMALPIGGSALVVAFRRDAFDSPATKEAAKAIGLTLEPPKTWEQFDALARFFQGRDWDGDGSPESGVGLAWAADAEGVGDGTLLSRAAALGLHPDQFSFLFDTDSTNPRVAAPPFVEALKAITALKASGPPGAEKFDADAARQAFRSGEVALLIDRAERAETWGSAGTPIGVAPLPGSTRVFNFLGNVWEDRKLPNRPSYLPHGGGWLVGIAASTQQKAAAEDFVKYLAGPDSTNRLRAEKGFPMLGVRASQLSQGMANPRGAPGVEARPWADAVSRTLTNDRIFPGPRFPGAVDYLADLTKARVAAVNGQPVESTLEELSKAWAERTKALGQARQTWHHRRSLTGLSTSPEPPTR